MDSDPQESLAADRAVDPSSADRPPGPRFYERAGWRAALVVAAFFVMCTLLALLFPETYWRF